MIALDTNVLVDIDEAPSDVAERVLATVSGVGEHAPLVVCGAVFAELCAGRGRNPDEVSTRLKSAQIRIDVHLALDVWKRAGTAYAAFARRRHASGGGEPRRILTDFIIGAHACTIGTLVSSDAAFYRRAFPELCVVDPLDESMADG